MYQYLADVIKVYDGDTITVDIDLGFGVMLKKQKIRLLGINTPEIRGEERPEGLISRDRLSELILNKRILIITKKDSTGKYGRWLADIYPYGELMEGFIESDISYNQLLLNEGLSKPY